MGNTRNTGYLQNAIKVSDAGAISFMSGSTMLATINTSGQMSGSSPVLFAATASFANAFTVAGTLTAQTLVVQTITSSVDFVTGSTRFGSLAANTHTFTGSVLVSGSIGIGTTPTNTLNVRGDNGTSTAALVRLRDTNATARTTRLQFEDYAGTLADGLIDFKIGTAGNASTATLSIGINSAGLTFNSSNAATFSSSVTATSATFSGRIGTSLSSTGVNLANSTLYINNTANTKGAIFGYDDSNDRFYFTSLEYGIQYKPILFNTSAATFAGSIGASSAGISSTSITTTPSTTLSTSRGIIVDAATTTNNAFVPIGFSWASSVSTYDPTWGMALKTVSYNAGTADLVFYTAGSVRMTIGNGGGTTFASGVSSAGRITGTNISQISATGTGSPQSLGLNINAGSGGRAYLLSASAQWDANLSTSGDLYLIRCGYNNDLFTATFIAGTHNMASFSQSGGILHVTYPLNYAYHIQVLNNQS
jgi:hypothetical protein